MARLVYENNTKVIWCTAIANPAAPTAAEIAAGINLSSYVAKDGVAVNINTNNVDSATINETFDAQLAGSWGANVQLTMFRDSTVDTAYTTCVHGTAGFLVIARFTTAALPGAGAKVEVWPAQMHQPAMENSAPNAQQRFVESFAITSRPSLNVAVV